MSNSNSVNSRRKRLLNTGNGADVHFLVGEGDEKQLLPAHKALLGTASNVFETMFRYDAQNAKSTAAGAAPSEVTEEPIEVPDVEVSAFKAMLAYIYADDLRGLNGENAIAVLYAANKYDVSGLIEACVNFTIGKLSNVFDALVQARFLGKEVPTYIFHICFLFWDFAHRCLGYIDVNAATLILSKAFLQIDQKLLCEILDRDELMISEEIAIWNAARNACEKAALQKAKWQAKEEEKEAKKEERKREREEKERLKEEKKRVKKEKEREKEREKEEKKREKELEKEAKKKKKTEGSSTPRTYNFFS
uniref:BTB domain-containing protein n=1 Tax=Globodera rostochiensis TaxID=31243 RepID=A0A914H851_GLORO